MSVVGWLGVNLAAYADVFRVFDVQSLRQDQLVLCRNAQPIILTGVDENDLARAFHQFGNIDPAQPNIWRKGSSSRTRLF